MQQILVLLLFVAFVFFSSVRCVNQPESTETGKNIGTNTNSRASKMKIRIGSSSFSATLYDNATAAAFKSMLPLTVNMVELNGNEKYVDLPRKLPTNASNPGTIKKGDLMLYGSSTLVLFYKTFSTTYSYTPLGRIDDIGALADAVGSGNVTVIYELE